MTVLAQSKLRAFLIRETAVSMAINATLSALFVFLMFGRKDQVGLWGFDGMAVDFVPQTFIIAFMATLVPSALTRKAINKGKVERTAGPQSILPRNLVVRSLSIAALVSSVAIPSAILIIALASSGSMTFTALLPMKIAYGAGVACIVTSYAIRTVICERATT